MPGRERSEVKLKKPNAKPRELRQTEAWAGRLCISSIVVRDTDMSGLTKS